MNENQNGLNGSKQTSLECQVAEESRRNRQKQSTDLIDWEKYLVNEEEKVKP